MAATETGDDSVPAKRHRRPAGVGDTTVEAVGKLSEAFEITERARGHLYAFHQLTGGADLALGRAAALLGEAGHDHLADRITADLIGRNVLEGRWTFQVVEEYDDGYYSLFREIEREVRDELLQGRSHVYEAEMKEARRTHGRPGHEARPQANS
ncbi:hypothetical protein AB0H42_19585 [Nocardia sp. NPDC050799]|uniref:hypothetical protein n=1 Tax=Nocardia sp. NPDC050799 TaxID=3154842 RepID=UPI0033EE7430